MGLDVFTTELGLLVRCSQHAETKTLNLTATYELEIYLIAAETQGGAEYDIQGAALSLGITALFAE